MGGCRCNQQDCLLCDGVLLDGLSEAQVCQVRGLIEREGFKPGTLLFLQGVPATRLYVLRSGYVKLTLSMPDGREQLLGVGAKGQVLGFTADANQGYPCTAQALTTVTVCSLSASDMYRVLEQNPGVSMRVIRMLHNELERSQERIRDLGLKSSTERVASFLLDLLPPGGRAGRTVHLPLSRAEIAEMLGLTIGTVSRCMAHFRREGLIETPRGRVTILAPERLRQLADGGLEAEPSPRAVAR